MIGILLASMMLIQEPEALSGNGPSPAVARELEAIERQMHGWHATVLDGGTCQTGQSSGDPRLDDLACQAMSECSTRMRAVSARLNDSSLTPGERRKIILESNGGMTACVTSRRAELFKSLAEGRALGRENAAASENSPQSKPPSGTVTVQQSLTIPDEIAPAMIVYVNCRVSSRGVPIRNERGETIQAVAAAGDDCIAHRKLAAERADSMLRQNTDLPRKERRDLIQKTLNSIDESTSWGTASQTEKQPNASN